MWWIIIAAAFILFPATKKLVVDNKVPIYDWILAGLALLPPIYLIINNDYLTERLKFVDPVLPIELLLGTINIILLLEGIRRVVVPAMSILIVSFIGFLYVSPWLPSVFYSKAPAFSDLVEMHYLITDSGIYGSITGVSATFVATKRLYLRSSRSNRFSSGLFDQGIALLATALRLSCFPTQPCWPRRSVLVLPDAARGARDPDCLWRRTV